MADQGVDVSSYQHPDGAPIDYTAAYNAGVRAVAVKLTEGVGYVNPYADADMRGFAAVGCQVVPYHFGRPDRTQAADEAAFFVSSLPVYAQGWPRALDIEVMHPDGWRALAQWVTIFGRAAAVDLLYENRTYQRNLDMSGLVWPGRLWIAAPSESTFPDEAAWWQYGTGPIDGIPALVDLDQIKEAVMADTFDTVWNDGTFAQQVNQWIANQCDAAIVRACEPGGQIDQCVARHAQAPPGAAKLNIVLSGTAEPA